MQNVYLASETSKLALEYPGIFHGVNLLESDANKSPPSGAEVKNRWSYNSTPPVRLHGVDMDSFTF